MLFFIHVRDVFSTSCILAGVMMKFILKKQHTHTLQIHSIMFDLKVNQLHNHTYSISKRDTAKNNPSQPPNQPHKSLYIDVICRYG